MVGEGAEAFDLDDHGFVIEQPALGRAAKTYARGCAGADDVSGFEWGDAGEIFDEGGDFEDEIAGVGGLHDLAGEGELDVEGVGGGDFVFGGDGGAEGGEGGEAFAERPLRGGKLDSTCADVVADGVTKDVIERGGGGYTVAGFADDDSELGFVVGLGGVRWKKDFGVGASDGGGEFHEDCGDGLNLHFGFGGVLNVVEADAEDAWRVQERSEDGDTGERDGSAESGGCAPALDEGKDIVVAGGWEREDGVALEDAATDGAGGFAVGDELHGFLSPDFAVGEAELFEGLGENFDAVAGVVGDHVMAAADDDGMKEVFVKVVDVLDDTVGEGAGDGEEVEDGEVLDVLAEADAAGVGADGNVEFCSHEKDGEVFVDAGDAAAVDLADVDGAGLEQLLEHDGVVAVFAGGNAGGSGFAADAGVAEDVVRAGGLFHPPDIYGGELAGALDRFDDSPLLVGVDHHAVFGADFFADDAGAAKVVCRVAADFELEVRPAVGETFAAEAADLVFAVAEPAGGGGVGGISGGFELGKAVGLAGPGGAKDREGFVGGEGVGDVAEVDAGDDLLGGHVGEQTPEGLAFGLGVEVPDGVDEGGGGEVDDTFFGAEPAELGVAGDFEEEGTEVVGDGRKSAADDLGGEVFEGSGDELGAAAEGEGEAVAGEGGVGFEDAVGGGVVGVFVDGVGADLVA